MKLEEILGIKKKILLPLVVGALAVFSPRANAQGPPPVSELRGFIDPSSFSIDSVFAYNQVNDDLLASSSLFDVDTVTVEGDTVTVPNAYRFVIQGASLGDTLSFRAKNCNIFNSEWYDLIPIDGVVIYEPGEIKRVDMWVDFLDDVPFEIESILPKSFSLNQNYPNPFNSSTTITYELKTKGNVCLDIYNVLGRKITTLFNGPQRLGSHQIDFDGKNLVSGVYFLRMSVDGVNSTKKMVLLK